MSAGVTIRDIAQVVRGVSFDKDEVLDEPCDGYLPILRAGNIDRELLTDRDLIWVPQARIGAEQRLRVGDIAICMSSGSQQVVGKTAPLRTSWEGSVGAFCAIVRPHPDRVFPEFLSFFMQSERFRTWTRQSSGANIKNIRKSELEQFGVPLPSLVEQQRIVDLLSRAEGIVRLRREAQKKAAEIIPALFLDMFGDPAANPKGWLVRPLGELLARSIRNGVSPSRTGTHKGRVLTLSAITSGTFDATAVKDAAFAAPLGESDEVSKEDFLVCRGNGNRELVGVACFPDSDMRGVAFPDTAIAVRPRANLVGRRFLAVQWQTLAVRQQVEKIAKTTNGTYKINQTGLSGVKLILPPEAAQQTFDERARSLESITRQQAQALARAEATFRALLARAFSSDLTAAAMVEEAAAA